MRVILYPRVSSKKQLEEGDSIEAQTNRLKKFCEEKGYEIVGVYTDGGKSASIKEDDLKQKINGDSFSNQYNLNVRPAFKKLLQEAQNKKFDAIVFYKYDRFSRDIAFAELSIRYFNQFGIRLIPTDDSEDPFVSSIMRAVSTQEIKKMKERVRLVRMDRFEKGVMVGKAPIGYKLNRKKKIMEINPKEAEMVKQIFEKTARGEKYSQICKDFKIKPQSYYNIIRNKVYIGIVSFEGKEIKGIHAPIISEEIWRKVNKK